MTITPAAEYGTAVQLTCPLRTDDEKHANNAFPRPCGLCVDRQFSNSARHCLDDHKLKDGKDGNRQRRGAASSSHYHKTTTAGQGTSRDGTAAWKCLVCLVCMSTGYGRCVYCILGSEEGSHIAPGSKTRNISRFDEALYLVPDLVQLVPKRVPNRVPNLVPDFLSKIMD